MSDAAFPLPPGSVIGIFGGGQLGRMAAMAAARLGYRCHIYCPDPDSPAFQVSDSHTAKAYDDMAAIDAFADAVDVVTFEFENVPDASLDRLTGRVPVHPSADVLRISQDRAAEKTFINNLGIGTAPWRGVTDLASLEGALAEIGRPSILKTARFGYDGKGQTTVRDGDGPAAAWATIGETNAVLEGFVDFACEISVIVARGVDGSEQAYVPVENEHRDHILYRTTAPARIDEAVAETAMDIARRIADGLDLIGLLAIEMFVTRSGDVLVNEIAPRPHNSGHWTIDACTVSQFEQFVRAVVGVPLGSPERHSDAEMINLIGAEADDWASLVADPKAAVHLYGKAESRPGRKMGHVTRIFPRGGTGT